MKYWNLTYNDPKRWQEVYAICGKPLSLWQSIRLGGSGSPRGFLLNAPGDIQDLIDETSNIKYCNVQRMDAGGLLYFKVRLEVYGIPFSSETVLRVEHFKAPNTDTHALDVGARIRLVFRDHQHIDIGCSAVNGGRWQSFLGSLKTSLPQT